MMEKEKLRKADIFSGAIIFMAGVFIVSQALQMPMKDSWGGVQNVWYVSPAIFPLFVGAMIMLLGALLVRTAINEVGLNAIKETGRFLGSNKFRAFLKLEKNIRFYAVITALISFVYLFIPRMDFFLAAILFLMVFISMFHLDDPAILMKFFGFYMVQLLIFILFLIFGLTEVFSSFASYPADILGMVFIPAYGLFAFFQTRKNDRLRKKLRTSFTVAFTAPVIIGMIFKYLLLVPMPFEGLVVELMDLVWYM